MIQAQIQAVQNDPSDQGESLHQVSSSTIEPALRRNMRKQGLILFPTTEQFGFHMPTAAFTDQRHSHEFAVGAHRRRSWPFEKRRNFLPDVIHDDKYPG